MLKGKQKNLDLNKNGKLDAEDFKMLRGKKMKTGGGLHSYDMAKGGYVVADMNYKIMGHFKTENEAKEYAHSLSKKDGNIYRFGTKEKIERHAKEDGYMAKGGGVEMKKGGKAKRSAHSIEVDSEIKAKKPGRRVSASGNVYYESRPNHSDENRKKKPYLEMGGEVEEKNEIKETNWVYSIGGL
jgi:hypothetical protein